MINDPIVEEVRRVRQELFERCGCDLDRYMEFIRKAESQHGDRLVTSLEELRARRDSAAEAENKVSSANPPSS